MVAHSAYEDLIHLLAHTAQSQSKVFALFIQRIVDFSYREFIYPRPQDESLSVGYEACSR